MFHVKHNAARPRRNAAPRLLIGPTLLLTLLLTTACAQIASPEGWASPIEAGDTLITQTESGVITLIGTSDGNVLRSYPADGDDVDLRAVYATPILNGDTVYIASHSGIVVALDIETLIPVRDWGGPIDVESVIIATPAFRDGLLYVATEEGALLTIDVATGQRTTLATLSARIWGRPEADSRYIYVAALDDELRAIDRSTGQIDWRRDVGAVAGDLLIDGDLLLVPSFDGRLYALDLTAGGADLWSNSAGRGDAWFWARPLIVGDTVYAATVSGAVYAFRRANGAAIWRFHEDDTEIRAAPVLLDGVLVIASRDGHIYGINPTTGVLRWTALREGRRFLSDPLVLESEGVVVYADNDGNLLMVTPSSGNVQPLYERG